LPNADIVDVNFIILKKNGPERLYEFTR